MENIMTLHENKEAFNDAIRAASEHLGIRDVFVEKDYWVTLILQRLSQSEFKNNVIFKGGTSLSKVHKLINRFSEDVDLAILKSEGQTETQQRVMIRRVEKEITSGLHEIEIPNLTSKQKNFRKTAFNYDRITKNDSIGLHDKLILEINSFANPVPYNIHSVNSMIAQFLTETENIGPLTEFNLLPFELFVLDPRITLIEKILSLIRLSFYDDGVERIRAKVRHFYDIYYLINTPAFHDPENISGFRADFIKMFEEEKTRFFDPENWYNSEYAESPLFKNFTVIWDQIKYSYENDFRLLVFGEFPSSEEIVKQSIFLIEFLG
jgi:hypothetical protein